MTLIAAAVMAVTAIVGARLVEVCVADVRVARAQAVADAVALAGVWGDHLAVSAAARNSAALVDVDTMNGVVTVVIDVDGVERAASAA